MTINLFSLTASTDFFLNSSVGFLSQQQMAKMPANLLVRQPTHMAGFPKTPAYVVGERILKPMIDASTRFVEHTYGAIKAKFASIDRAVSRMFNWPPVAQAASDEESKKKLYHFLQKSEDPFLAMVPVHPPMIGLAALYRNWIDDTPTPVHGGKNRKTNTCDKGGSCSQAAAWLDSLTSTQKQDIFNELFTRLAPKLKDVTKKLQKAVSKYDVNGIFEDMYSHYHEYMFTSCSFHTRVISSLSSVLDDLKSNGINSIYSPLNNVLIRVLLPEYSENFQKRISNGRITLYKQFTETGKEYRGVPTPFMVSSDVFNHLLKCKEPEQLGLEALFDEETNQDALLAKIDIKGNEQFTFNQFKNLAIQNIMKVVMKSAQSEIDLIIQQLSQISPETFASAVSQIPKSYKYLTEMDRYQSYTRRLTLQATNLIYQEYRKLASKEKLATIKIHEEKDGFVISWEEMIYSKRRFLLLFGDYPFPSDENSFLGNLKDSLYNIFS